MYKRKPNISLSMQKEPKRRSRPTILIVEDDLSTRETLETLLSPTYHCQSVCTLAEARNYVHSNQPPAAILLDLRLPDGSGDVLLDEAPNLSTKVIVLTAVIDLHRAIRLMSRGLFYYLTKDCSPDEILSTVARAVSAKTGEQFSGELERRLRELFDEVASVKDSVRSELWHLLQVSYIQQLLGPDAKLKDLVHEFEKRILETMLHSNNGHRMATAKALGIHMNTLFLKMRQYKIQPSSKSPRASKFQ